MAESIKMLIRIAHTKRTKEKRYEKLVKGYIQQFGGREVSRVEERKQTIFNFEFDDAYKANRSHAALEADKRWYDEHGEPWIRQIDVIYGPQKLVLTDSQYHFLNAQGENIILRDLQPSEKSGDWHGTEGWRIRKWQICRRGKCIYDDCTLEEVLLYEDLMGVCKHGFKWGQHPGLGQVVLVNHPLGVPQQVYAEKILDLGPEVSEPKEEVAV